MKREREPQPTYFNRWRRYPKSCAGHTMQGLLTGLVILSPAIVAFQMPNAPAALTMAVILFPLTVMGFALALGYWAYQFGSGARKAVNRHKTDSIGWDSADLMVGLWFSVIIATGFTLLA